MQTIRWECEVFLICVFYGICANLCYDILRILRRLFSGFERFAVVQDFLYWILIGILFSYVVFEYNDGRIRAFLLIEFALGMLVENLMISPIIVPMFIKILEIPINFLRNVLISIKLKSINFARRKKDGSNKARISQKKKKAKN